MSRTLLKSSRASESREVKSGWRVSVVVAARLSKRKLDWGRSKSKVQRSKYNNQLEEGKM
jgi:hypothetical protein